MKVTISLSPDSVKSAIKQIKTYKRTFEKKVIPEFVLSSLEWIKSKAISYLKTSAIDPIIIGKIEQGFLIQTNAKNGALVNTEDKAVYIEFGVGIKGKGTHPEAASAGYEYDVPSDKKTADGGWTFKRRISAGIDILPQNRETRKFVGGTDAAIIYTHGQGGELFVYNACMDYMNSSTPQIIFNQIFNKYLG